MNNHAITLGGAILITVDSTIAFTGNTVLVGFGGAVTASYYTVIIEDLVMLARNKAIS